MSGRGGGHRSQYFGPAYGPYGGGGSRGGGRGHGARWQGGRGGFPPAHLGQNHGQGYGRGGYDGSQHRGQGDWQHTHEQLRQCQEALREARRSNEEVEALHRARRAELERDVQRAKDLLDEMKGMIEEYKGLRKGLEERDQIIAQKSDEIRSAIAERDSIKGELESLKEVHRNLRSDSDRVIEDLKRKGAEAKNDAAQAKRDAFQAMIVPLLTNEKGAAEHKLQSVKRSLLAAREAAREKDRLISQKDARIQELERILEDHNDMMPWSSTQDDATLPGPAVEVPTEIREHIEALGAIEAWEEWFQFVEDNEFNNARTIADVGAILGEARSRRRLREFLIDGPLDTWACLSRVGEHGFFTESVTLTDDLRCLVHNGGVSCRLVMVTTVDSVRRLRFLNRTGQMQLMDALDRA